ILPRGDRTIRDRHSIRLRYRNAPMPTGYQMICLHSDPGTAADFQCTTCCFASPAYPLNDIPHDHHITTPGDTKTAAVIIISPEIIRIVVHYIALDDYILGILDIYVVIISPDH